MLSAQEFIRYNRQIMLEDFGEQGQLQLKNASVIIIGLGGLGCSVALNLAYAGVGCLTLVDQDQVEASNLARQVLFTSENIGQTKIEAARQSLANINPSLNITSINQFASATSLATLINSQSIVLDCTDNIESKLLINKACVQSQCCFITGSAIRFEGQIASFDFSQATSSKGCYACLMQGYPHEEPSCASLGVLTPVVSMIGSMQALSAMKAMMGKHFISSIWQCFDGKSQQWQSIKIPKNKNCLACRQG